MKIGGITRAAAALSLAIAAGSASADVITWTNATGDNSWNTPANWNLGRLPNSSDDVYVWTEGCGILNGRTGHCRTLHANAMMILNGTLNIQAGGEINAGFSQFGNSTFLMFRGDLYVNGQFNMFSGFMMPLGQPYESTLHVGSTGTLWSRSGGSYTLSVNTENGGLFKLESPVTIHSPNGLTVFSNGPFGRTELYPGGLLNGYNGYFGNNGMLNVKPGYNAPMDAGLRFYNDLGGVVKVESAIFAINNPTQLQAGADTLSRGSYWLTGGAHLYFPADRWISNLTETSHVILDGPGCFFYNLQHLSRIESTLALRNFASFTTDPLSGYLTMAGRLEMGQACSMSVGTRYHQVSGSVLIAEIGTSGAPVIRANNYAHIDGAVVAQISGGPHASGTEWPIVALNEGHVGFVTGSPTFNYGGTSSPTTLELRLDAAVVRTGCAVDFNADGFLDFFDYDDFVMCFETGNCPIGKTADFNSDDFVDFFDYDDFVHGFESGC